MRDQIFAFINTRKINSTLKYKLWYTINNTKSKRVEMAVASSAARFEVRFSCVTCIPVVVTTLQAFSGKLPDFFISCCDCWRWQCSRQRSTGLGILESGNRAQYCKIDIYCFSVLTQTTARTTRQRSFTDLQL